MTMANAQMAIEQMSNGTTFLVDDNDAFRRSTQWLLESHGIQVSAFADGASFLDAFEQGRGTRGPSCILLDVRMPGPSGLQVQEQLRARGVSTPIIFVAAHSDVALAVQAMRRGAFNFLEKPFAEDTLIAEVMAALAHDIQRVSHDEEVEHVHSCLQLLTPRERQVLDLVMQGALNKTIGAALGISVKTVELHRSRVMEKMRASSLAQLIQMTMRAQTSGALAPTNSTQSARP
jgi:two-component system response regulator FixJ